MSQIRITKQRPTAGAARRRQAEPELPLDLRDPDIVRAKQLRRPSDPRRSGDVRRAGLGAGISA
jgi:hypothetical protein